MNYISYNFKKNIFIWSKYKNEKLNRKLIEINCEIKTTIKICLKTNK